MRIPVYSIQFYSNLSIQLKMFYWAETKTLVSCRLFNGLFFLLLLYELKNVLVAFTLWQPIAQWVLVYYKHFTHYNFVEYVFYLYFSFGWFSFILIFMMIVFMANYKVWKSIQSSFFALPNSIEHTMELQKAWI